MPKKSDNQFKKALEEIRRMSLEEGMQRARERAKAWGYGRGLRGESGRSVDSR